VVSWYVDDFLGDAVPLHGFEERAGSRVRVCIVGDRDSKTSPRSTR
jgi:hypothetical protein